MKKINELFSKGLILLIKESFIFIGIKIILFIKDFFYVVINQSASQLEIERLNHQVSLSVSEFVISHQNSFENMFIFLIFLFIVWGLYILVKDGLIIINIIKKGVK